MEQEKNRHQIIPQLEQAGFRWEEVIHDIAKQSPYEPAYLRILTTRQFYGEVLRLEAILSLSESTRNYELTEISISERFKPAWQKRPLVLRAAEGDYMNVSFGACMFTGRFDTLLQQLHELELAAVSDQRGDSIVRHRLKDLPDDARVQGYFSNPSGTADYSIHIVNGERGYNVVNYTMKFTLYPKLRHGIFAGVDTAVLERDMAAVNWANEHEILLAGETEQVFHHHIQDILNRLEDLSTDMAGGYTGHILQLKYMQTANLSDVLIDDQAWETFARLPQKEAIFPADIPLPIAANLMAGRCRLVTREGQTYPQADTWQKMNGIGADGAAILEPVPGYPWTELLGHVRSVTGEGEKSVQTAARIAEGNLVCIMPQPGGETIFVRADPAARQLDLLTPDMRVIPFNFRLDPEWKPVPEPRGPLKNGNKPFRKKFPRNPKKGKGLK